MLVFIEQSALRTLFVETRARDGFAGTFFFYSLPLFALLFSLSAYAIANDRTLERRRRFVGEVHLRIDETLVALARVKARGRTFVRVRCLSKGIVVAFT